MKRSEHVSDPHRSDVKSRRKQRRETEQTLRHARRLFVEVLEQRQLLTADPLDLFSYLPQYHELIDLTDGYLTGPNAGDAQEIARSFLQANVGALGITETDVATAFIFNQYSDETTGTTHLYFQQFLDGLEVVNAWMNVNIGALGQVINVGSSFVSGLDALRGQTDQLPHLTGDAAILSAGNVLGLISELSATSVQLVSADLSTSQQQSVYASSALSKDAIPGKLVYVPTADGSITLSWELILRTPDNQHWYSVTVDAVAGSLLSADDWMDHDTYDVLDRPTDAPNESGRVVVTNPADPLASPYGWHDTNGVAGAEYTDTRGNNVSAQEDHDANDSGGYRPDGGQSLVFDFPFNTALDPTQYVDAAITNLFYWNNLLHDIHYHYGFTEAAGNFQVNNYGRGGLGNDAVQADAQDGSGTNNANFGTPADGSAPRMQMYIWTYSSPSRDSDLDNGIIIHEYGHGVSNRLTGGGVGLSALQSTGMGEGWSDWWALMLTQRPTDLTSGAYGVGTYVYNQLSTGAGIRRYRYSFDMSVNPLTIDAFGTSGTTSYGTARSTEVHNTGEIWAETLWDLNCLLVNKYGFSSNLMTGYTGAGSAGNILALQLVMNGLKLQAANPSFLAARNAILTADQVLTGGQNQFEIWTAFARRGMGLSFVDASANSTAVTAAFDMPAFNLRVSSTTPALNSVTAAQPVDFVVTFSETYDSASVNASDLRVNGIAASSFDTTSAQSITFHFSTSPVTVQGIQTMTMAAGAVLRLSDGGAMDGFTGGFRYDAITLGVASTTPTNGSVVSLPFTTLDIQFNEAYDAASIGTDDLSVTQGAVTAATQLNATTVRYTLSGVVAEGTFGYTIAAGAIVDVYGNPGSAFSGNLFLDLATSAFPVPLTALGPQGSLIYRGMQTGSLIGYAGDDDRYTLTLDGQQRLTLIVAAGTGLIARVELRDASNAVLGAAVSAAAGSSAVLQSVAVPANGLYTIVVSGSGGTTGAYTVQATLNAAVESESSTGPSNDTIALAQNIDGSFTTLGGGSASRGAVVGRIESVLVAAAVSPNFTDISTTGTRSTAAVGDDAADTITEAQLAGFSFFLFGTAYRSVSFNTNGLITFGGENTGYLSTDLSSTPAEAAIAVLWDDLFIEDTGTGSASRNVFWQLIGSGQSQQLVIQWNNARQYSGTTYFSFQAVLSMDGTIQLNYAAGVSSAIVSTTAVGVKAAGMNNPERLLLSYNQAAGALVGPGLSTRLRYEPTTSLTSNATISSTDVPKTIADLATVNSTLAIATHGTIQDLNLALNLTHSYDGDLRISLISPTGTTVILSNRRGSSGDNYTNTVFDDEAATAITAGTAPFTGSFRPEGLLSAFDGQDIFGTWTLKIEDLASGDSGTLNSWSLTSSTTPIGARPGIDYYVFSANAGESVSLALSDTAANFALSLYDSLGALLVSGASTAALDALIGNYSITANGTYYVAVSGNLPSAYDLVVTRGAAFDNGQNQTLVTAQSLGAATAVLGYASSSFDFYSIVVAGPSLLTFTTSTPGDQTGEFVNGLNPALQLYDAAGNLLASNDNGAADGINARLTRGLSAGTYTVRTSAAAGTGEYLLSYTQVDLGAAAPVVVGVFARGTGTGASDWGTSFTTYLGLSGMGNSSLGYLLSGGANQVATLPWSNVNTISLQFSEGVTIGQGDLTVIGASNGPLVPNVSGFSFNASTNVATWTFAAALPADKYLLHLGSAVIDSGGASLDGEWITSGSTASGNGTAGGDFNFRFNVLAGDFDGSNSVTFGEVGQQRLKVGRNTGSGDYNYRQDYDGSGTLTFGEVGQSRSRVGTAMSTFNEPVAPGAGPQLASEAAPMPILDGYSEFVSPFTLLTMDELAPVVFEAIARWRASGLVSAGELDASTLHFQIVDLGPAYLGLGSFDGTILIDDDGAGWGWFVDATPQADEEFTPTLRSGESVATSAGTAFGRMDLLTTVMHELGHRLGYADNVTTGTAIDSLMAERLSTGERRAPAVPVISASDGIPTEDKGIPTVTSLDLAPAAQFTFTTQESSAPEHLALAAWAATDAPVDIKLQSKADYGSLAIWAVGRSMTESVTTSWTGPSSTYAAPSGNGAANAEPRAEFAALALWDAGENDPEIKFQALTNTISAKLKGVEANAPTHEAEYLTTVNAGGA